MDVNLLLNEIDFELKSLSVDSAVYSAVSSLINFTVVLIASDFE
jgi:hypothetical protein